MPKIQCPSCGSTDTCEIMYGLPAYTESLERDLNAGKVHLGGCIIEDDAPDRHCNKCEVDFNSESPVST